MITVTPTEGVANDIGGKKAVHENVESKYLYLLQFTTPDSFIQPATLPAAPVVFLQGLSDHSTRSTDLFQNLVAYGIQVCAFDQRGWGRSSTKPFEKERTGPTSQVLADITYFISTLLSLTVLLFLLGHAMGGQEVMTYACQGPLEVRDDKRMHRRSATYQVRAHRGASTVDTSRVEICL